MITTKGLSPRKTMKKIELTPSDIAKGAHRFLTTPAAVSRIVLKWHPDGHKERRSDIGAICYRTFRNRNAQTRVDPQSLIRHPMLVKVVHGALEHMIHTRTIVTTATLRKLLSILGTDSANDISTPQDLVRRLSASLHASIASGHIGAHSAHNYVRCGIDFLVRAFKVSEDTLKAGLRPIRIPSTSPRRRPPLTLEAGKEIGRAAVEHFLLAVDLLITRKALPCSFNIADESFLVTTAIRGSPTHPRYVLLRSDRTPPPNVFYGNDLQLKPKPHPGRNAPTNRQALARWTAKRNRYWRYIFALRRQRAANARDDSMPRLRLIGDALVSFAVATYIDTGANIATLQGAVIAGTRIDAITIDDLPQDGSSDRLTRTRFQSGYSLQAVKRRAGNKSIAITFSSKWISRLYPAYLQLRSHLEGMGLTIPKDLLFHIATPDRGKSRIDPNPRIDHLLAGSHFHPLRFFMRRHGVKRLVVSDLRNLKSVQVTRTSGARTSASLLGHTLGVALDTYNRITEVESQLQLARVITDVASIAVLHTDRSKTRGSPLAAGGACIRRPNEPEIHTTSPALGLLAPDCKTRSGCWTCKHFAVHADKVDLWKLHSYLYVLSELRSNAAEPEALRLVHEPIVNRLDQFVKAIESRDLSLAAISSKLRARTQRGHLHPLYKPLLAIYENTGVV